MRKDWRTTTLGHVLEVQNGYAFDSKQFSSSKGMPLIRIRSLKAGTETETRFSGDYDKKYVVNAGDLLIGMDGEFGCYEWKGGPALLNQRVCRLQGFGSQLDPRFLFHGVNSHLKAIEDVTGFTTVKHLSSKQILSIEFALPPIPEQRRIVGILDEAFTGIAIATANTKKNLQNSRAIFESHLQSVFTYSSESWTEKSLGEMCEMYQPKTIGTRDLILDGPYPVFGANGVIGRYDKFNHEEPQLLITCRGATCGSVNVSEPKSWITGNAMVVRPRDHALDLKFLEFVFLGGIDISKAITGAAQPQITRTNLSPILIRFPASVVEQRNLAEQFESIADETKRLESLYQSKLTALDALKRAILYQAFSGQL